MQWNEIYSQISEAIGGPFEAEEPRPISGGDTNQAFLLEGNGQRFFVKLNGATRLAMFEAEHQALLAMAASKTIRVPTPLCCGVVTGRSFIVMEYIELGRSVADSPLQLGRQLAAMHQVSADQFGWHRNNTIGTTLQRNDYSDDWLLFWRDQRIGLQLKLLAQHDYVGRIQQLGDKLLEKMPLLLAGYKPEASMLHGDLWSGNYAFDRQGTPFIFDPAFYYGDRETDLAMTELFGGFTPQFYSAYREAYPLDEGYEQRRDLYNLYHVLNHGNLFGGGYVAQAEGMIERLLSE